MAVKCIVIDDEPLSRELLASYISSVTDLELVGLCANAMEAFEAIHRHRPGLLFLDIRMPGMDGLELLRSLSDPPAVVIVSAYRDYALEGFDLDVTDFLLKPVLFERFVKAVSKLMHRKLSPGAPAADVTEEAQEAYMFFRVNKEMVKVNLEDIIWIESLKDYVKIRTATGELLTYQRISYLEERLPAALFLRVHRSFIVAMGHITGIASDHISIKQSRIPLGRSYKNGVFRALKASPLRAFRNRDPG